jgi:dTDP-4-amino-4,6-dideoxygalactose transaminase
LAVDGGEPVRRKAFPRWPVYDEREERQLMEVLHSGEWGALKGSKTAEFQARFAAYQGARFGICVPNGTLALEVALSAVGVGPGDEVVTTPYTFVATANSAISVGAVPVFADIDLDSYNIDPAEVEKAITPRTKAIMPVHMGGRPADLDALREIAARRGVRLVEDACQAWGSEWQGRRVGAIGEIGAFSFQSSKNITAGEGGIIVTNDETLAEAAWSLHNVGRVRGGLWYYHEIVGRNLRITEWQSAVLLAQLERLDEQTERREANAACLSECLSQIPGLRPLGHDPRVTRQSRHVTIVRYDAAAFGGRPRDEFLAALVAEGIEPVAPGYVPLNRVPAIRRALAASGEADARGFGRAVDGLPELPACPRAEWASGNTIWLFQYALLGDRSDMDDIAEACAKIQRAWA